MSSVTCRSIRRRLFRIGYWCPLELNLYLGFRSIRPKPYDALIAN